MANTGSGRNLLLLCSQDGFYFCFLTIYKNAHGNDLYFFMAVGEQKKKC